MKHIDKEQNRITRLIFLSYQQIKRQKPGLRNITQHTSKNQHNNNHNKNVKIVKSIG